MHSLHFLSFLLNFPLRKVFAGSGKPSSTGHGAWDVEREVKSVCFYSSRLCTHTSVVTNTPDPFNAAVSQELSVPLHNSVELAQALSRG